MSRGTVIAPTITLGTAYLVIAPAPVEQKSKVLAPKISVGGTQTITPPVVT